MNEATFLSWSGYARPDKELAMTSANVFLKARVVEDKIVVESNHSGFHSPLLVGSSEPASVPADSETPSLTIFPKLKEGEEGLLVMRHPSRCAGMIDVTWPLRISLKDGKPWLHLKEDEGLWTCTSEERIGGVVGGHLEVCIDGKWYASDQLRSGRGCIPDPDLLCRYLVGKTNKEELLKVIQEAEEEKSAKRELDVAHRRIHKLEQQKEALERTKETLYAENEQLKRPVS